MSNTDDIERGDYVSWRLEGENRRFGKVIRRTTSQFHPAFLIQSHRGTKQIIVPAKYVTKEVG